MPNKKKLYEALKAEGYDNFADESSFNAYVDNADNRKKLFSALKKEGYDNFADETEFEKYLGYNSKNNTEFEANAERFRNGQPIERVTTQSVIDANPELGLGDQPYQYKPEVQQHILQNKPDMFKPKQSLMDAPLGINAPEGSDEKFQARIDVVQKNLQDPEYQKGKVKSEFRVLSDSVNADLEEIEDAITSRQKAVRNIDWKPGMPSSRDDAKLTELRGQRTYLEGAKELIEDSQNILNAVEAEKDGSFFGGLGRGVRDKAFDIDTWTMGLSDLVGGLRLKSVLEKAEKGEELTPAEEKLLDASVNNMAVNFYYRNDLGLGYQAGEITGQSIPFMLEFLVNPVSASGNAMAKRLLTYGLKKFGSAVNSKAIKAGTRLATDALAAGGVTATTGMGNVLSGGVERLNRNYEYGLDEEGNLNVVNTHNMDVGEAFAKSATSAFLERQSEMIFNAFRGAPSLFKGIETSLPGGVNTFMNYVSNSRLGELWRGIKNNATMKELAKRTQFHGLGEEYLEEVYNNFANIPLGEMTFEEATDLENNIVTFLGLAPTQVMFSAIGGIGYGVERYKAKRDLERTFGKMTEEQKRKLIELQEMGKLSTNKDIAFFLAETIKDENLTPEQKRAEIEYAYNLAKQNAIDEVSNTDVEDSIESENQQIDAATDPQTGMYGEVMLTSQDLDGNNVVTPANVFGEKEVNGELYLLVLPEGETEKKWVRPSQYDANSYQKRPAEEVKAINEEMIREEAAQQAEQEAKYAPEVLNAQMQQGVPFNTPNAQIIPVAPMPEGNGWIVEEYALDTNNKVAKTPIVRELTNDEYRDMLQAQLNAEEAAQEQIAAEEQATAPEVVEEAQPTEEADVKENLTTETGNNLSPVEEVVQPQAEVQAPVIPTKEDGSIDFVSYGKEGTFKTLGEKYGEKMPNKVAVTAKALSEDLKKAQNKLQKAEEAYDNAPIGREQKAEEARDKAKQELEAIQREANFWAEMDAEIKDAQARRESMLNPQAEVETSTEPMNVDEFVAQQLASGNIVLDKEDYKKETGYGDTEANAMNGGATKLFGKNGMTIQEAGERLMEIDRENGTNFFDQLDSNSGRDALINVLGSVKSRKELNQYIATNRAEQAKRESEGLRNELEKQAMEANYASLEDYVLQMEVEEMENPFLNDRADEIMAIFAEEAAKYEQSLNNTENGQGTENEVVEGNDSILPEEQLDNTGRTEVIEESERVGDGTSEASESTHAATEVELKQEEGETTLQFAERAAEENRRRPLRKRAEEWSKALGVKVHFIEKLDDVDNQTAYIALSKGSKVAGWYEGTTGKVFFYMPNLDDISEVDKTYIHEVVAHKGLREMLGRERFNELCDKVWDMMPDTEKAKFIGYPGVNGNTRAAADEYIAYLSEKENLTPEEKTMWDRVVKALRDIFEAALNSIIGKTELTDEDISNLIKASYANLKSGAEGGAVNAESNRMRAVERIEENVGEVDAEKGDVRFAVRDVLKGEERAQAINDLMAVTGRSKRTVEKWLKAEESLASVILNEDNVGILDMEADESVPSIWKNSDYPQGTVEFSNICKKRLPFTTIYQRLQKEFPDTLFDAQTLNTIRNTMKEMGEDVACALCFVEDRRQLLGEIGQGFIDAVKGMDVELNDNQKAALNKLRESGDKYVPNLFDIITLDGMKELRKKHPAVAQAFIEYNNARGMQSGRLFQAYSAYNREILKYNKKKVESINNNGGLRIFSFSDFEAHHLIDLVQVLTDCAAKGIKVQGYTKVPEFAKAVKDTNAKINRSLIPKGVGYVDADYTPKEGEAVSPNVINGKRLLFDTIEGIDVNNPNFFDSTGSKSVGNILVAINDEHARLAMADPFVDYIIGFHTGQSKAILKGKGIDTWVNYKNEQLDKEIVTDENGNQKMKNAPHHGLNIYTDVLNVAEAEGNPIRTAKQFTERFIEECNKRGWIPRFHRFLNRAKDGRFLYTPGYHKFLIDFKLFDKNGRILPQEAVVPVFDNEFNKQILDDYVKGVKEEMPNDAVYEAVKEAVGLGEGTRFRVTPKMDAEYMEAVNNGDMDKAQQMVDKVLEGAGYTIRGEHGTTHKFTIFSNVNANIENSFGKGFYFTSDINDAEKNYASDSGADLTNRIELLAERMEFEDGYEDMSYEERVEEAKNRLHGGENLIISAAIRMENPCIFSIDPEGTYKETIFEAEEAYDEETDEYSEPEGNLVYFVNSLQNVLDSGEYWGADNVDTYELLSDGYYTADQLKSKMDEMLMDVQDEEGNMASSEIFRAALEGMGFDGIIDNAPSHRFKGMGLSRETKHYIAFSSNQIKQSDAVTYDNDGNVIPLSQRANIENDDIRFRLSEKGKQIQAEVDKFTSKYNSKPVELIDPEMTDEEIEDAIDWQQTAKDLKAYIKESKSMGGYVGELDKILIFVENMKLERMEEAMFHENLHPFVDGGEYDHLLNKLYENGKDDEALSRARRFSDREPKAKRPLEFFNYAVSYGQVNGNLDDVLKYFDKEEQAELLNLLKENGYDYYQEQEGRRGNAVLDGLPRGEENSERVLQHQEGGQENNGRVSSESQEEKLSPAERKARLNELFNKVADMGLQGVLGNKEYTSLMVDIYKALPEEVRAEIAEDAIRLYGGSVAPAVSDYIGPKSKNSIMDKVVTIVREALRKIGFDLDLNANEVRYMAWRSKKPLDRNNMFEVAEDIDMKYRLKVGEYDGTTPDGGGTRFRVTKEKLEGFSKIYKEFKADNYGLPSYAQDAVDSALGKMAEEMKAKFGDNAFDFFNNAGEILTNNWIKQYEKENPYFNGFYKYKDVVVEGNDDAQDLMDGILEVVPKNELEKEENIEKYIPSEVLDAVIVPNGKTIKFMDSEVMDILQRVTGKSKGEIIEEYGSEGLEMLTDEDFDALHSKEARFRITPKMDAEYLESVNSGDNKKVAKLVKDAAKAAMPNTKVVDRWGKPKVVYHGTISPERFNEFKGETIFFTSSYADANLYSHKREGGWLSPKQSGRPLSFFLNIENPLVIDAKGRRWSDIPVDWTTQSLTTDDVAQYANDNGYDGVIINKVKDSIFTDMSAMTVYIAFSSSQIKDAGSTHYYDKAGYGSWRIKHEVGATYDDNGNLIPLSERFNPEEKDIRFRVANKLQVRDEYESTIKKGGYQAREAVQDAMLSLRKFQELIEKASGKKIRDFENAWMHENRLSSVVQAEIHDMERKFYKPMMDAVKKLMSAANLEQEQVADYLMLKHGIERNREMAVRKALTDDKGKIDRTRLEQWYQDKRNVRNDATLDTWRKKQEAMDNAALNYGADMSRDYSGLTSMFGTDDLADSTQKAYDEVEALENAHPVETESLGKAINAMTQNTLDKSFESGLMDRKVYDELSKDMYDYYIPLRGFEETTSEEVYAYLDQDRGAFNAPLKRAKGRSSKSDNPIAYLKSIAESGIMQGNRNKMKQSFLNMVINNPSDLVSVREGVWVIYNQASGEWEAASAPAIPNNATPADVEAAMEAWEQQMEQAAQNDPNIKKVSEAEDVPYRVVGNRMDQHQIIVKRLGKSYTLTINGNPRLAMAINGQTNPNNTSNDGKVAAFVNNKIGALNRSLAAWYTTRNPDFVASNFMRDTFYTNTIVRAKEGNAYANKFHKNYATVLPKMLGLFRKYENGTLNPADQTEAAFIDFMMNGGETGYSNLKDLEHIKKQISKELKGNRFAKVEALAEKLDILNRAVENTARFAAFLTSREEGRSIARSVFDAKEISVNFNKKGAGGTFFGMTGQTWFGNLASMVGASGRALYVFFNAAIQGTTNLMHVMKVNPKGTSAGLAAMFLMGAVIPFLFDDDDEKDYYDLPEHVRRNHLIIPGAGDAWVSIPLPIEYRIMYGMGELLTSWRTGHERGSDIGRKMLNLTGQALPLNFLEEGFDAFIPSALSPVWQVYNNRSWTGLPIYKDNEFNKDDPEYTKAYKNVDRGIYEFTKALYNWTFDEENQKERIDLNPAIIEALARGYFGGLATQLSNIGKTAEIVAGEREFDWRSIPIGNRLFKSGDERTKEKRVTNEYFENMEKLDFLQSRERMLKKTEKGVAVPEADKFKAQKDLETMQGTEVYKKYQEFKKQKKVVDKIRKTIKEKGSTPEREKQLMEAQEAANKSVR